jgi:hypothetical protein
MTTTRNTNDILTLDADDMRDAAYADEQFRAARRTGGQIRWWDATNDPDTEGWVLSTFTVDADNENLCSEDQTCEEVVIAATNTEEIIEGFTTGWIMVRGRGNWWIDTVATGGPEVYRAEIFPPLNEDSQAWDAGFIAEIEAAGWRTAGPMTQDGSVVAVVVLPNS